MAGGLIGDIELIVFAFGAVVAGLVAERRFRAQVAAGQSRSMTFVRTVVWLGLFASVYGILVVTLWPRPWLWSGGVNLVPFASIRQLATNSVASSIAIRNLGGNILLFVPFGFFAAAWRRGRRAGAVAIGAAAVLSVAVEVGQAIFPLHRSVDVDDVILNVCGAALGAGVLLVLRHVVRRRTVAADRQWSAPVR